MAKNLHSLSSVLASKGEKDEKDAKGKTNPKKASEKESGSIFWKDRAKDAKK
jgi:hypothetical protein